MAAEVETAIMTSVPNKTLGPDGISFQYIQYTYQVHPGIFNCLYNHLLQ